MRINKDNLQYIFANLITHSRWVKKAKCDMSIIKKNFNLTDLELNLLYNFLNTNGQKLLANALLSEEKRWREFLNTIKYIDKIITLDYIKNFWYDYLDSFLIREIIPPTPSKESIRFLDFLLKKEIDPLLKNLVHYEILRNTKIFYKFPKSYLDIKAPITERNLRKFAIWLNPSFSFKQFEIDIPGLLLQIIRKEKIIFSTIQHKSCIGFYKHPVNKLVKTIQLNPILLSLITSIKRKMTLHTCMNGPLAKHNMPLSLKINFIKELSFAGVILIDEIIRKV